MYRSNSHRSYNKREGHNNVKVYKEKFNPKTPLSHIMFDCLMNPELLKIVLTEN